MAVSFETFTGRESDLQGGLAQNFSLYLAGAKFRGGSRISLPGPGVTAFVGGNNVGKSTILRQLATWIGSSPQTPVPGPPILDEVDAQRSGTPADLLAWLYTHRAIASQPYGAGVLHSTGFMPATDAVAYWTSPDRTNRLSALGSALTYYAGTQQRFEMSEPAARRSDFTEPASNPLQALEDDPSLLKEISRISIDAFGQPLLLDPLSGNLVLRVGKTSVAAPPVDAIDPNYRAALSELTPLHEQGDGMRSMIGLLLPIVASTYPIVIVDEPEAFLHPPQARILGREMAALAQSRGIQIILATHDRNILTGLMDANVPVSVVRLSRRGNEIAASQLIAENLRTLWSDPSLRYSNILDGLFHRAVVLAENERDCRFFNAALESAHRDTPRQISPHDILFIPTAGKTNMRPLAGAMRACGVPTVASVDLDLLNDKLATRALLEAMSGEWSDVSALFELATAQFRVPRVQRQRRDVLTAIAAVLEQDPAAVYNSEVKQRVQQTLAVDSPWRAVKDFGMTAFRTERQSADALIAALDQRGIVLAREGELEGFARDLGVRKGAGWVPAALRAGAHEAAPALEHVTRLVQAALTQESLLIGATLAPVSAKSSLAD